ncbi:MAG: ABC transporter permease subunit, partial [Acidimicrobiia bacterium]
GLTEGQSMRSVVLPQAVRRMVPAIVSQLITLLKDTSLGSIIGYEELLKRSDLAAKSAQPVSDLQAFLIAGAVYVVVNLTLSRVARRLESAQRRRYGAGAISVTGVEELTVLSVTGDTPDASAGSANPRDGGASPPGRLR